MEISVRARIRALVLAVVIAVQAWMAVPLPPKVAPQRLRDPVAREEIDRWRALLSSIGIELSKDQAIQLAVHVSEILGGTRQASLRPLQPGIRVTGIGQSWALFAAPDTHPSRLELHARVAGTWQPVYRRLDDDYPFLASVMGFRKVRGVYDSNGGRSYDEMAKWAADRVFEAYPAADAARMRLVQTHATRPGVRRDEAFQRVKREVVVERGP